MSVQPASLGGCFINTNVANLKLLGGTDAKYLTHGSLLSVLPNAVASVVGPVYGNFPGSGLLPWANYQSGDQEYVAPPAGTSPSATGTWVTLPTATWPGSVINTNVVIGCSYAYRNQTYITPEHCNDLLWSCGCAGETLGPGGAGSPMAGYPGNFPSLYIPGSGPADPTDSVGFYNRMPAPRFAQFQNACPERKTTKTLGSLAIAADRFDTHLNMFCECGYPYIAKDPPFPMLGMGAYGHKVGYNILFGDGHAAWYPDPQQFFVYCMDKDAVVCTWGDSIGNPNIPPNQATGANYVWCGPECGNDFLGGSCDPGYGNNSIWGHGSGIFTMFDDWANHEAVPGFYLGQFLGPGLWDTGALGDCP